MRRLLVRTTVAAALLALVTACGASEEEKAADAVASGVLSGSEDEGVDFNQEQADCVGEGFVDELGVDKLEEYGIITDDQGAGDSALDIEMSEGDADQASSVMVDCIDSDAVLDLMTQEDDELTDEQRQCLEETFTDDLLQEVYAALLRQDEEATAEAFSPLMECATG